MNFDAQQLAPAWLSVALVSGTDKDHPSLDRTVSVEQYTHGARLVATDGVALLHAWIPELDYEDEPEPELDEAPISTAVARDQYSRARGFMTYLFGLAFAEDAPRIEVRMRVDVAPLGDDSTPILEGMTGRAVIVEYPDHEKLILELYEGDYPNWRPMVARFRPEIIDRIALNPDVVGRLAKLGRFHGNRALLWRWGGELSAAALEVAESSPRVAGLVMPVRWDFDHDMPREAAPKTAGGDGNGTADADDPGPAEPADEPFESASDFLKNGSGVHTGPTPTADAEVLDEFYGQARRLVVEKQLGSTSMLQRLLGIGYGRATRIVDSLERAGVVGAPDGVNPRSVLMTVDELVAVEAGEAATVRIDSVADYIDKHADEISADLSEKAGMPVTVSVTKGAE